MCIVNKKYKSYPIGTWECFCLAKRTCLNTFEWLSWSCWAAIEKVLWVGLHHLLFFCSSGFPLIGSLKIFMLITDTIKYSLGRNICIHKCNQRLMCVSQTVIRKITASLAHRQTIQHLSHGLVLFHLLIIPWHSNLVPECRELIWSFCPTTQPIVIWWCYAIFLHYRFIPVQFT